jgi:hypothetical protein
MPTHVCVCVCVYVCVCERERERERGRESVCVLAHAPQTCAPQTYITHKRTETSGQLQRQSPTGIRIFICRHADNVESTDSTCLLHHFVVEFYEASLAHRFFRYDNVRQLHWLMFVVIVAVIIGDTAA